MDAHFTVTLHIPSVYHVGDDQPYLSLHDALMQPAQNSRFHRSVTYNEYEPFHLDRYVSRHAPYLHAGTVMVVQRTSGMMRSNGYYFRMNDTLADPIVFGGDVVTLDKIAMTKTNYLLDAKQDIIRRYGTDKGIVTPQRVIIPLHPLACEKGWMVTGSVYTETAQPWHNAPSP